MTDTLITVAFTALELGWVENQLLKNTEDLLNPNGREAVFKIMSANRAHLEMKNAASQTA